MRVLLAFILCAQLAVARDISKEFPPMACGKMCSDIEKKAQGDFHKKTYHCECHNITAPDGFVMQAARILPQQNKKVARQPVFLMHGFLTTGMDWVAMPKTSDSLPYILSDAGFDVWLGNNRGNIFSIANSKMDINTQEFWDAIDVDTMASQDMPSILKYVLAETKASKMHWVGHSQGGGMLLFALAKDPTLKDRLDTSVLLAPGVHMANLKVPLLKFMSKHHIDEFWHEKGFDIPTIETSKYYFPGPGFSKIMHFFTANTPLCRLPLLGTKVCNDIGKILGINVGVSRNIDWRTMAEGYSYDPGGSSFHLLMHWAQRIRNDTLLEFDWGANNSKHYNGSTTPPVYNMGHITGMKLGLFDGDKDLFITKKDIDSLLSEIPQENFVKHTTLHNYAHMDFVWGNDAHVRLYPEIVKLLSQANTSPSSLDAVII